jgi:hypothetical protein
MRLGMQITARLPRPLLPLIALTIVATAGLPEAGSGPGKIADNSRWLVLRNGALLLALFWLAVWR